MISGAQVALIDYGAGNLHSARHALEAVAKEAKGGAAITVTANPEDVWTATHVVLPGVGAFKDCMDGVAKIPGMLTALHEAVRGKGRPFLGICVGMQLMAMRGHEHGTHEGLGWLAADVVRFEVNDPALKVPHMGWNNLSVNGAHPVLENIRTGDHAYFLNSYYMKCEDKGDVLATADHGGAFTAMVARDTMVGTQFHPEKSQATGLKLLTNFLNWRP